MRRAEQFCVGGARKFSFHFPLSTFHFSRFARVGLALILLAFQPIQAEEDAPWWQHSYEGDAPLDVHSADVLRLGTDKKFHPGPEAVSWSEEGIWRQDTGAEETHALAWAVADASSWNYSVSSPVTVEVRLKVNKSGVGGEDVPVGVVRMAPIETYVSGGRTFYFYYGVGWVALGGSNLSAAKRIPLDTAEFHAYRIVLDPNPETTVADLYIDNDPAPAATVSPGTGEPGGTGRLVIGDTQYGETGLTGGDFSLDYLRWAEGIVRPKE